MKLLYKLILCHFVGDYFLQTDFLAQTKGANWWHLLAHCVLYSLPFFLLLGFDWRIMFLIATHVVIDALKARWCKISYVTDQTLHLIVLCVYFLT